MAYLFVPTYHSVDEDAELAWAITCEEANGGQGSSAPPAPSLQAAVEQAGSLNPGGVTLPTVWEQMMSDCSTSIDVCVQEDDEQDEEDHIDHVTGMPECKRPRV